jgi:DHA3 family macrolide efflux protein-like MFS transporter
MKEQSHMKLHSFFESLRELRTFLLLFTTQALSSLGSAMTSYALVIWAYQQSGSALSTALLTVSSYAPYVVFSLFCGALVDRLDTRRTMLVSDALAACTTVAALVLLQTGRLQITHLYLLNALNGLMNTLQQPASEAATTALLPKSQYQRVGGLRYLSSSLSGLLTPVLAMALMTLGGLRAVMFADLATFAVAFMALLCFVHIPKRQTGNQHESFLDSTRQGLRFFRQAPGLLTLVLYLAAINLVSSMYEAALPSLLLSRSWGGENAMGIFSTVTALATLIGSLLAILLPAPKSRVRVVCGCLLVSMGTENFLLAFGQNLPTWCVGAALGWLLIPVMSANLDALMRLNIPEGMQGRVYAVRNALQFFTIPVGYTLGGALVDAVFRPLMRNPLSWLEMLFGRDEGNGAACFYAALALMGVLTCLFFQSRKSLKALEGDKAA